MVDAAKLNRGEIQDHMSVIGSDGMHVGTVDKVEGEWIKLTRSDPQAPGDEHRYLPLSTVARIAGGMVELSMPAAQVREAMETESSLAQRRSLRLEEGEGPGQVPPDAPHGSRARAHGPKGNSQPG